MEIPSRDTIPADGPFATLDNRHVLFIVWPNYATTPEQTAGRINTVTAHTLVSYNIRLMSYLYSFLTY